MIAIIDYGAGNLRSIVNAFEKIGAETRITTNPKKLGADAIVLPGVGNFGDAMGKLSEFKKPLLEKIDEGIPFLGLCLGIQVIFEKSDEAPGVEGLGIFEGTCKKFSSSLKVPHMGWNNLEVKKKNKILQGITERDYFYFVHSYYPVPKDREIVSATTKYGVEFPAVVSKNNVYATQFHPEKSGIMGLKILKNFVGLI